VFLFRALASGSSGNAYLLRTPRSTILFEAGLRLPLLSQYLLAEGVQPEKLTAVFISHEHRDHCLSARDLAVDYGVPVCANSAVLRAAGLHELRQSCVLDVSRPTLFGDVEVTSFPVQHDSVDPVGFLIRTGGRTIALATDTGEATGHVAEAVQEADLVVLEANHDTTMLHQGRYPYHLRRRVGGPKGHLSNTQAAGVLAKHVRNRDTQVWLAHLSKENNTPALAVKTVKGYLKPAGLAGTIVDVVRREKPSLSWNGTFRPRQLNLFEALDGAGR
jgi:phosphoribosyl 1,2-cyclic phosphodiesterase